MGGGTDATEVEAANLRHVEAESQAQSYPIAQSFSQFALASGEGLVLGPYALKAGDFAPIGAVVLDDFVVRQLQCGIRYWASMRLVRAV